MFELVEINKDWHESKEALKQLIKNDESIHPSTVACMLYVIDTENPENLMLFGLYKGNELVGWIYASFEAKSIGRSVFCSYSILNYGIAAQHNTVAAGRQAAKALSRTFADAIKQSIRQSHAKHLEVWSFTVPSKKGTEWIINKIDKSIYASLRKTYLGRLTFSFSSDNTLRPYFEIGEVCHE